GCKFWVDQHFAGKGNTARLGQKCEWKAGRKAESFLITPTAAELQLDLRLQLGCRREEWEVGRLVEYSRSRINRAPAQLPVRQLKPLSLRRTPRGNRKPGCDPAPFLALPGRFCRYSADRERRQPLPRVAHVDCPVDLRIGEDVLGHLELKLQTTQTKAGRNTRHQNGRKQDRDDDVEQVVSGIQGCDPDDQDDPDIYGTGASDLEIQCFPNPRGFDTAGEIGDRGEADQRRQQESDRSQKNSGEHVARLAGGGRKD